MAVTVIMVGCGSKGVVAAQPEGRSVPVMHLPAISHNDSLRFKMYYYEAVKQQISGNYDAAYDLLEHCIGINPNAAEAYFMLSFYDGILKGDSAAFADVKKASELNPSNNAYLERIGVGYVSMGNLDEAVKAYEKLSRNSPERSDVLDFLAQLYSRQKDYDKMLDVLNRMEALEGASEDLILQDEGLFSARQERGGV